MESWTENNKEIYTKGIEEGYFVKQAINFDDNFQGLYVPTYVIEGDPERGIEPMAPDLKYITDLPEYWELFQDPENKDRGKIVGAISGWNVDEILHEGFEYYNLGEHSHYFRPGSESALNSSLVSAYEKGDPWIGYSYEPTWVLGKYDMTPIIEEDPDGPLKTLGAQDVNIITNKDLSDRLPDAAEFLQNYGTTSDLINDALGFMESEDASAHETAIKFLKENEDIWLDWVSDEVAEKVKDAID